MVWKWRATAATLCEVDDERARRLQAAGETVICCEVRRRQVDTRATGPQDDTNESAPGVG